MSKTFVNLRNLESKEIIQKLKRENCITLYGNCHRIEESIQFKNNYEKVLKPKYWNLVKQYYNTIEKNLRKFKFREN